MNISLSFFAVVEIIIIITIYGVFKLLDHLELKKMNAHQSRILDASIQINLSEIMGTFDQFIDLVMTEYLQLNVEFNDIKYINSELEEDLLRKISKQIMSTISPFMISKLSLIFHINNEKELADIVSKRVYLKLLEYITKINAIKDESTRNVNMFSDNK